MANALIKAERIVRTSLGILERDVVLPRLVWRDAVGDFSGAKNDTISIRLPAYMNARRRTLRANTALVVDELVETVVPVTLDTDVYKAIGVTLEELTLDVESFESQIAVPATNSVGRDLEDLLAEEMEGATYETTLTIALADQTDGWDIWPYLIDAKIALDRANVPIANRYLACGGNVEAAILKSDRLSKVDQSGSDSALRDATIGRIASFLPVSVPGMDQNVAIAAHKTAFVMSSRAPAVPQGAVTGASRTFNGFGLTAIQDYDFINTKDRFAAHCFVGTNTVMDRGTLDATGRFTPDPAGAADPILVRAVKIELATV